MKNIAGYYNLKPMIIFLARVVSVLKNISKLWKFPQRPVLITPPYIPAGMTGMRLESAGMQINSTGIAIFLQESNRNPLE